MDFSVGRFLLVATQLARSCSSCRSAPTSKSNDDCSPAEQAADTRSAYAMMRRVFAWLRTISA